MKRFLFLLLLGIAGFFVFAACGSEDDGGTTVVKTPCATNANCPRDQYCDLEHPELNENYEEVYYCTPRDKCSAQAPTCAFGWKCCNHDKLCVTDAEYLTLTEEYCNSGSGGGTGTVCHSNTDCTRTQYCDLDHPQQLPDGTQAFYCRDRLPCSRDNDNCAFGWQCCYTEGVCVTTAEFTPIAEHCDPASGDTGNSAPDGDTGGDTGNSAPDGDTGNSAPDGDTGSDTGDSGDSGNVLFSDNFDDGGSKWATDGQWAIGTPTAGPSQAFSAPNAACTNLSGNYADDADYVMAISSAVAIPSGYPVLTFKAWVDTQGNAYTPDDYMEVLIKDDLSKPWAQVAGSRVTADTPKPKDLISGMNMEKINGYLDDNWYTFTVGLHDYAGKEVLFGFHFVSDSSDNKTGVCVDDVAIKSE